MADARDPSPLPRTPHLLREPPKGELSVYVVDNARSRVSLGRGSAMDVVVDGDPSISRLHALLETLSGEWLVIDGGLSRNGTFVNGERVTGQRRLRNRDRLQIGRTTLTFCLPPRAASPRTGVFIPLPELHRRVLAEIASPLRRSGAAVPATDTDIARTLAIPLAYVRHAVTEICVLHGIVEATPWQRRSKLLQLSLALTPSLQDKVK